MFAIVFVAQLSVAAAPQPAVVSTSSRWPEAVSASLASVDVISRADIERLQARDAIDLLRGLPGVDVARAGGAGAATSVFLRGANSNHALVLIDGVRVASATTGAYAFEQLPIELIERIEIVRGPRAALYGSDAIGGVVQFFTRRGAGRTLLASAADDGEFGASATAGLGDAESGVSVAVERRLVDGFNATTPDNFSFDPDDDGFRRSSAALQAHSALGERLQLAALAHGSDGDIEFDQGRSALSQRQFQVSADFDAAATYSQRLALAVAREDLRTPAFFAEFDTDRETLDWLHRYAPGDTHQFNAGIALMRERGINADLDGNAEFDRRRWQRGVFGQWQGQWIGHRFEAALRHDRIDNAGGETTAQLAWAWQISDRWRTLANIGEGFRAPHFNELYSPGFGGFFAGNPDLAPEKSRQLELGLDGNTGAVRWRARAYRNRIDDLIAFAGQRNQAINIRRARIDGLEIDVAGGDLWRWSANATFQNPIDESRNTKLLRRAKRKFNAALDYPFGDAIAAGLSLTYASEREDFDGPLDGYVALDLRASWRFAERWTLETSLSNAADEEYQLVSGYATPGRQWRLALRYRD